ncbi:MAG: restriction endonuclease subunit S [Candidatus Latescibacteria bacterium]|nr:restriction endonuclease subunit S [Candidatus Latescibacterota bacterium]
MSTPTAVEQRRLKYAATINDDALAEDTEPDYELQYVDIGNVDSSGSVHEIATYRFADAPSRARRQVRDGDVIISTVRTYLQAIAPIQQPPDNLIVSTGFAVVRPRASVFDAGFCKYALREPAFLAEVEMRSVGVSYPAINASDLGDIQIHLPGLRHQRAVADYLDRETARLDALVAAKERLLGLLAEKRRALITRAVTRGLAPNVLLRDSGLLWLGQIPAHWGTSKFSWSVSIAEGQVDPEVEPYLSMLLIAPNHIESGTGKLISRETAAVQTAISGKYLCQAGDVIYSKIRPALRKATLAPGECLCSADMYPLRPRQGLDAEYLLFFLLSEPFSVWAVLESDRVAMPKINRETLNDLRLPVPPLQEQKTIIAYIASETAKLDALRAVTERTIGLLKERRAALIAAAVEGKGGLTHSEMAS